jgi:hypothetical protein
MEEDGLEGAIHRVEVAAAAAPRREVDQLEPELLLDLEEHGDVEILNLILECVITFSIK